MAKVIFEERQRFNQWWLWLITIMVVGACVVSLFEKAEIELSDLIQPGIVSGIMLFTLFGVNLKTRIDEHGIHVKMFPFHFSEVHYLWTDLNSVKVKKYSPLMDYGGWGVRGFGDDKAFNVRGSIGIKIQTTDGRTRMIGTQKEEEAKVAIKSHFSKEL